MADTVWPPVATPRPSFHIVAVDTSLVRLFEPGRYNNTAGTISAIAKVRGRPITQAWSRYFYENPATYKEIDGLIYSNAHNDEDAIVLYERAASTLKCPPDQVRPLSNPALRAALLEIAFKHNLKPLM